LVKVSIFFLIRNAKKVCCAPDWAKFFLIQYGKHNDIREVLGNVIPNWCGVGYHCWYHYGYPTNTGLHPTQSPGLLAIKFEKFDLSFMIALVNLSSNGSSVSLNLYQRLCALPHMHGSINFLNLRSKPLGRVGDRIWGSPFVLMRLSKKLHIT
jgi:hypothetical protein